MNTDYWLCVDWGKETRKRAACVADVRGRSVDYLHGPPWTLAHLLDVAASLDGRVVIAIDAALGIPKLFAEQYFQHRPQPPGFLEWLQSATRLPGFLEAARAPEAWHVDRPFISVPPGEGGLRQFWDRIGHRMARRDDVATGAKSPFIVSGIPGVVGAGSRALWQEIGAMASRGCRPEVWPYDRLLGDRRRGSSALVAEIYPRVCYALALSDTLPAPLMHLGKTKPAVRAQALDELVARPWVKAQEVRLPDLEPALRSEDDFDALISAAALLRCSLEGLPVEREEGYCPVEGGILGMPLVDLARRAKRPRIEASKVTRAAVAATSNGPRHYRCPIPGCEKRFVGSRGGWDAHVASQRMHPHWHPDVTDHAERKALFRTEFPEWFVEAWPTTDDRA